MATQSQLNKYTIVVLAALCISLQCEAAEYLPTAVNVYHPHLPGPTNWFQDSGDVISFRPQKCKLVGERWIHWADCKSYFECHIVNGEWNVVPNTCPSGWTFDDTIKECVELYGFCPQEPANYPPIAQCNNADEVYVDPIDCDRFFRCHLYRNGLYYPEHMSCHSGQSFDQGIGQCVQGPCPQNLRALPDEEGWHCAVDGETNILPGGCAEFYTCVRCSKAGWCFYILDCPPGYMFDDKEKTCVKGLCVNYVERGIVAYANRDLPVLPKYLECEKENEIRGNWKYCRQYYKCVKCNNPPDNWCYDTVICPGDTVYDDVVQDCVKSKECTKNLTEIPKNWQCEEQGQVKRSPDDCRQYYTCIECAFRPRGWCHKGLETCPNEPVETFFDENTSTCVPGKCPVDLLPITGPGGGNGGGGSGDRVCTQEKEERVDPENCANYYTCYKCSHPAAVQGWCYYPQTCTPEGTFFDQETGACVSGPCPQDLMPIEPEMTCMAKEEVHAHPTDCQSFYTCYECKHGWCYIGGTCPRGQYFDEHKRACIDSDICPQLLVELEPGMKCSANGEIHVHPSNCHLYYTCYECDKGSGGWCYLGGNCGSDYFDEYNKKCISSDFCPQSLKELEPGMECRSKGEVHVNPSDCHGHFTCYKCPWSNDWCYLGMKCQENQYFDDSEKRCVDSELCPQLLTELEPGMICSTSGEINVHPSDCHRYYTCYRCHKGNGWCIIGAKCEGENNWFDDSKEECVKSEYCPQDPPPTTAPITAIKCTWKTQGKLPIPGICNCFAICRCLPILGCSKNDWCCLPGSYYDPVRKGCYYGSACPAG